MIIRIEMLRQVCQSLIVLFVFRVPSAVARVKWSSLRCDSDVESRVPEGVQDDVGRFPWLGVIQHNFRVGKKEHFAVTTGVLIHPSYAIAAADDMARIPTKDLLNNTRLVLYHSRNASYTIEVNDYILHPDYYEALTYATIALVELMTHGAMGIGNHGAMVFPVCLPFAGSGTFEDDLYAVKITDELGTIDKAAYKMTFIDSKQCDEYYKTAQLYQPSMMPVYSICAAASAQAQPCVWDNGVVLIKRIGGFWKLLGFALHGPGCSAPTRFLYVQRYLRWMDEFILHVAAGPLDGRRAFYLRQQTPNRIVFYAGDLLIPKEFGYCERGKRGTVAYKERTELISNRPLAQGFYHFEITQQMDFGCLQVDITSLARTTTAVWIDHHCYRDFTGISAPLGRYDDTKQECFMYFKSTAYIEFRFLFSFEAEFTLVLWGILDDFRPDIDLTIMPTTAWYPTDRLLKPLDFFPYYRWAWLL